jgi:predicted O-methyltransferase YrrM
MPDEKTATILMEARSVSDAPQPESWKPSQPWSSSSSTQHQNMANTLCAPQVRTVLNRLFDAAAHDDETPRGPEPGVSWESATAQERADASECTYMPISQEGGDLLYILVRAKRPNTIVEFGMSYGISTIYLAAAVADNGAGHVVSTELSAAKIVAARANLAEAGLADHVTILPGDAMTTLNELPGPIDLVLLDGWKDLCLPLLRSLESRLAIGALIVADDITFSSLRGYLEYVRNPASGYVSVAFPVEDGMEISCRTAAGLHDERSTA